MKKATIEDFYKIREDFNEQTGKYALKHKQSYVDWLEEKVVKLLLFGVGSSKPETQKQLLDSEKKCKGDTIKDYYIIDEETLNNLTQSTEDKTLS